MQNPFACYGTPSNRSAKSPSDRYSSRYSKRSMSFLIISVALSGTLLMSGCGKEEVAPPPPAKEAPKKVSAITPMALEGVTKAKEPFKIALIVKTQNNVFFKPMIEAFTKGAKEMGVEGEVESPAQETDVEQQVALVNAEAQKGVRAILIAPADSKALVPALKAAQDKGILVVNIDNRLDPATVKSAGLELGGYVGADNEEGGKLAGEAMLSAIGGSGKLAILEGIRGVDNAEARKRGFLGAVTTNVTIAAQESANWKMEDAYTKTQNILKAVPDLNGIFCANDNMAIGAMKAISEAGKKGKIKVVGYDNIPDVQPALKSGELTATIEQHPDQMGMYGLKLAVGILNGVVSKGGDLLVPLETVTQQTAKGK